MRQRISKHGHREALNRGAIYILFVYLGEVGGKTGGCQPAVRVPPRTRTRSQAAPMVPLNPRSSGDRCGIQVSLARAAHRAAAARRVLTTSSDAQRLLTDRPPLTAPPQLSLPPSPAPALYQKPPSLSRGGRRPSASPSAALCALPAGWGPQRPAETPSRIPAPGGGVPPRRQRPWAAGRGRAALTWRWHTWPRSCRRAPRRRPRNRGPWWRWRWPRRGRRPRARRARRRRRCHCRRRRARSGSSPAPPRRCPRPGRAGGRRRRWRRTGPPGRRRGAARTRCPAGKRQPWRAAPSARPPGPRARGTAGERRCWRGVAEATAPARPDGAPRRWVRAHVCGERGGPGGGAVPAGAPEPPPRSHRRSAQPGGTRWRQHLRGTAGGAPGVFPSPAGGTWRQSA